MSVLRQIIWMSLVLWALPVSAAMNELTNLQVNQAKDQRISFHLHFQVPVTAAPKVFSLKNPTRLVVDLPNTRHRLAQPDQAMSLSGITRYQVVASAEKTRLIIHHSSGLSHQLVRKGKSLDIVLSHGRRAVTKAKARQLTHVDFKGLGQQKGQIVLQGNQNLSAVDVVRKGNQLWVTLADTWVPKLQQQKMDVADFGTPVKQMTVKNNDKQAQLVVDITPPFEYFAYQMGKQFLVEVTPKAKEVVTKTGDKKKVYTGKPITLNFQDVKVRSVLQMLAEFTGLNIIVSDTVTGSVTLRLNEIPWDQALDIILQTRGLAKREMSSKVILIAPSDEVAAREANDLKNFQEAQALAPLHSELITVNYAKAADMAKLLKEKGTSLLSERGNVSTDQRTNKLWVRESSERIGEIRRLIRDLDVPVKQVLIEARIVNITDSVGNELGIRFGLTDKKRVSGTLEGANSRLTNVASDITLNNRLNVNLPVVQQGTATPARLGLALARLGGGVMLDLELSALESEGRANIVSSPRVITSNQYPAVIEAGEDVPFNEATSSGASAISFKKAVLKLEVTPQITPDNRIILTLAMNNDEASNATNASVTIIKTKAIKTQVLVNNGETVVLGGIYKQTDKNTMERVPFFGRLPVLGKLFSRQSKSLARDELVIFITPKIMPNHPTA